MEVQQLGCLFDFAEIYSEKFKKITPLQGFIGATMIPDETVELRITLGTYSTTELMMTSFLVVKILMSYNAIYGQPLLNTASAVPSTYHWVMYFSTRREGLGM